MAEIELKLELDPRAHARLKRSRALAGSRPRTTRLRATYYDTPDLSLRSREMALRMRRSGGRWIQTLKAGASGAGGLHAREEWEFDRPGPTLDLTLLADTPLGSDPDLAGHLAELFTVEMTRTAWEVEVSPGDRVEVALDRGEVRHGDRVEPVSEVEIESLAGDPFAVFDLAERLAAEDGAPALRPSSVTKAQRGYRLARGEAEGPVRASLVELDANASPLSAARAIAAAALTQLQANAAGVIGGEDPEYLHQYRVALRRLRSAIAVYRNAGGELDEGLREDLRWIARLTGPARDWDVLVAESLPALLDAYRAGRAARTVRLRAAAHRRRAHIALREALGSMRYLRLVLALARWIAQPSPEAAAADASVADFAQRLVGRRHKRLVADARRLSALTPVERHALRLDAKRLRYALEGLASLFRGKRVKTFLEALSEIQDDLGRANDAAVAARLLADLSPPGGLAEFARGWFGAMAQASAEGLERHAARLASLKRLKAKDAKPEAG